MPTVGVFPRSAWALVLLIGLMSGAAPVVAQPAPPPSPAPPGKLQDRIDAAARALRENNPRFKGTSLDYVRGLAEFVSGNMLFVLLHEMAHVSITQMGLPVLGRMEDAADTYATLRLIRSGSNFSRRVLTDAAEGWFMADRRDQKAGDKVAYYDDHGLNQQRAYQIVCLMVGSDDQKFKDLAKETKLPEERQDSCAGDYNNARYSWDLVLKPHRRAPDQPKTEIDVVYGPAEGRAERAKQVNRSIRLLETVAEHATTNSRGRRPSRWKCKAAATPTPAGTFRSTNSSCAMNSPWISQTSIAAMVTPEQTAGG